MTDSDVAALVNTALIGIPEDWLRNAFESFRVPIQEQKRAWEFDSPEKLYSIWIVADLRERGVGIAYADCPWRAPGWPWGLVWINDKGGPTGHAGWYKTLGECLRDSGYFDRFEPFG